MTKTQHIFGFNFFSDFNEEEFGAMLISPPESIRANQAYEEEADGADDSNEQSCGFWCTLWILITGSSFSGSNVASPKYSWSSLPTSLDWRDYGVVSETTVQQSSCGACWAIAAAQTIESKLYMESGEWVNLCTSEIVSCDQSGTLGCDGGWPQNAYSYVAGKGTGIWDDGGGCEDDYDDLFKALYENDKADVCAAITEIEEEGGNGDGEVKTGESTASLPFVSGYEYATQPCTCYVLGNRGCDCEEQDEQLMARNIASYGPAAVCLDASALRNYVGGILSAKDQVSPIRSRA